jgi:hypothetical protein
MSELPETLKVRASLCRPQELGELIRLNSDKFDGVPGLDELVILLAREIEPFIIGVGEVLIYETPKGLKVISRDGGGVNNGHVTSALAAVVRYVDAPGQRRDRNPPVDWSTQRQRNYIEFCAAVVNELRGSSALLETEFDAAREIVLLSVAD